MKVCGNVCLCTGGLHSSPIAPFFRQVPLSRGKELLQKAIRNQVSRGGRAGGRCVWRRERISPASEGSSEALTQKACPARLVALS